MHCDNAAQVASTIAPDIVTEAEKFNFARYMTTFWQDKKGVFRLKKVDFEEHKPIQDKEFSEIIFQLFPELKL